MPFHMYFWMHYCIVKQNCFIFKTTAVINSYVSIVVFFSKFTVKHVYLFTQTPCLIRSSCLVTYAAKITMVAPFYAQYAYCSEHEQKSWPTSSNNMAPLYLQILLRQPLQISG